MGLKVAVVGATGAVGTEMLRILEARAFPVDELVPLASARSAGRTIVFGGGEVPIRGAVARGASRRGSPLLLPLPARRSHGGSCARRPPREPCASTSHPRSGWSRTCRSSCPR